MMENMKRMVLDDEALGFFGNWAEYLGVIAGNLFKGMFDTFLRLINK
jgi:hypothetical protein